MSETIAGPGECGISVSTYTGAARDDGGPRRRYQVTRRDRSDLLNVLTLDQAQLRELYLCLSYLAQHTDHITRESGPK